MNKKDVNWSQINPILNEYFLHSNRIGSHIGCIRYGSGGDVHEDLKRRICDALRTVKHPFLTEARTHKGDSLDVVDLYELKNYELMHTEKTTAPKTKTYPAGIEIIEVTVDNIDEIIKFIKI